MTEPSATASRNVTGSLLDDVLDEISARLGRAEAVDIEDYARRHPDLAERLRKVFPAMQAMALLGRNAAEGTTSESSSVGEAALAGVLGDFRILRQVGRGGMGVVYEAEQISLGRRVALKVLPFASMLDPRSLARFRNEALAVAQLDHPHIVDVIGVGSDRGVHFYAMRFVDGRSLAEVIEALRQLAEQHPDAPPLTSISDVPAPGATAVSAVRAAASSVPGATAVSAGRAAASIETKAAAPSKTRRSRAARRPAAYYRSIAELAAAVAEALDHAHEQGIIHRDIKPSNLMLDGRGKVWVTDFGLARIEADTAMTMTGDLLGTLRYMSPEQAMAKRIVVDHRTDVYSLGVTLYELLTLRPAFDGESREEILRQIAFEEPTPPRRHAPGLPDELETILLKAIEKNPADRYHTAADLAADLRRYLEDKPVKAKRPGVVKRAGRWARKHRGVAVTAAIGLLMTVSAISASLGWTARQKALRRTVLTTQAERAFAEAMGHIDGTRWTEARGAALRAKSLFEQYDGMAYLDVPTEELLQDLELIENLDRLRELSTDPIMNTFRSSTGSAGFYSAFDQYGITPDSILAEDAIKRILSRPVPVQNEVLAAFSDWTQMERKGGNEPIRNHARIGWLDKVIAGVDDDPWRGRLRLALRTEDEALFRRLAEDSAFLVQPGWAQLSLGNALCDNPLTLESGFLALRSAQTRHPDDFWLNVTLFHHLSLVRRDLESLRVASICVALRPDSPGARFNLGSALFELGRVDESISEWRTATQLEPAYASAYGRIGSALNDQGRLEEALVELRRSANLLPNDVDAGTNLVIVLNKQGLTDEVVVECRRILTLDPRHAVTHNEWGLALLKAGHVEEAIVKFHAAVDLSPDLAAAHANLGKAMLEQEKWDEALVALRDSIILAPEESDTYYTLGNLFKARGLWADALEAYQESIDRDSSNAAARTNLGQVFAERGQWRKAIAEYQTAIRIDPALSEAHNSLGIAMFSTGDVPGAIVSYRKAIDLKEEYIEAHINLGNAYRGQGLLDEAIAEYRAAMGIDPAHGGPHDALGLLFAITGQVDAAVIEFGKAVELDCNSPIYLKNLGTALLECGRFQEAVDQLGAAIERRPDNAIALHQMGLALFKLGRLDEAIAAYETVLRIRPDDAEAHYNLGNARSAIGDVDAAIASYDSALQLKADYPAALNGKAWLLATANDSAVLDSARALELASRAVAVAPGDSGIRNTLGVAQYRVGDWTAAIAALTESCRLSNGGGAHDFFFIGMAQCKLGERDKARAWYEKGIAWMEANAPGDAELIRFRAEAEWVLGLPQTLPLREDVQWWDSPEDALPVREDVVGAE